MRRLRWRRLRWQVTDADVRRTIAEVDADGSGAISFLEFLLLSVPGGGGGAAACDYRPLEVRRLRHTLFENEDAAARATEPALAPLEIPEQCFLEYSPDADGAGPLGRGGSRGAGRGAAAAATGLHVECALNFKAPIGDRLAWSAAARSGCVALSADVVRGRWRERVLTYREVVRSDGGEAGALTTFVLDPPPTPPVPCLQKVWGVVLPREGGAAAVAAGGGGGPASPVGEGLDSFAVVSTGPGHVSIADGYDAEEGDGGAGGAGGFAAPSGAVRVVCGGAGTAAREVRRAVAAACFLPLWTPLRLSFRRRPPTPPGGAPGAGGGPPEQRELEVRPRSAAQCGA